MTKNLMEALLDEIQRVTELLHLYDEIPTGVFAATMMRQSIERAKTAIAEEDVVKMAQSYKDLEGYSA